MGYDLLAFVCVCIFIILSIFGESNGIGSINEQLEILSPDMRKVKLPPKFIRFVPQWCKTRCLNPEGVVPKSEVYFLTVILAILNYIFALLSIIATIVVFVISSEHILYILILPVVWAGVVWVIDGYYYFAIKKAGKDKFGLLENDFTITKEAENDKSDEMPESMTDNQDKCD